MTRALSIAVAVLVLSGAAPPSAQGPFEAVFVDAKTERVLGPFPYDRAVYAGAVRRLREAGAKAVVVKFFLDQPKGPEGDAALAAEMKGIPCFLQARLDDAEPSPNPMPARFAVAGATGTFSRSLAAGSGWIPAPAFADAAAGGGFVDVRSAEEPLRVPVAFRFQGRVYTSLHLAVLQSMLGPLGIEDGKSAAMGGVSVPLDPSNEVVVRLPASDSLAPASLSDLLAGTVDPARFKGKVVVLGYDGGKQGDFVTPIGRLRAHRLFYYSLLDLHRRFTGT